MAAAGNIAWFDPDGQSTPPLLPSHMSRNVGADKSGLPQFRGVFRGHELTRKDRRIACGLAAIDSLLDGGIIRGRISEIFAEPGAGKTSLASMFAASVTQREAAAWIEASDEFDPASAASAGVELSRLLWVSCRKLAFRRPAIQLGVDRDHRAAASQSQAILKAAEWILAAGGFGLVILDFGNIRHQLIQSAALRLARATERSATAVLVLTARRTCGTFAALSVSLRRERSCFNRTRAGGPTLFGGLNLEARVAHNKLGGSGRAAKWKTVTDTTGIYGNTEITSEACVTTEIRSLKTVTLTSTR